MAHKKEGYGGNVNKKIADRRTMMMKKTMPIPKKAKGMPGEMVGKKAMRNKK